MVGGHYVLTADRGAIPGIVGQVFNLRGLIESARHYLRHVCVSWMEDKLLKGYPCAYTCPFYCRGLAPGTGSPGFRVPRTRSPARGRGGITAAGINIDITVSGSGEPAAVR